MMLCRILPPTLLASAALLVSSAALPAQQAEIPARFRDPSLPLEARVDDLLGRLTVEEKISQIGMHNAALPRLGIPSFHWWSEGLHGVARNGIATVFPQAIGLAATWDTALVGRIGEVVSTEARAKYSEVLRLKGGNSDIYEGITIWSPNINIFRDPRWGRGQETFGEDPFLTGELGVSFVRGLQGSDPRHLKTVATLKHFAVHSGPEAPRHSFDSKVGQRDLRETYLPAFEAGVKRGGATSVMSAYNAVNGVPAPGNAWLLTELLRGEWGFTGAVVGDVGTVDDMHNARGHRFVKNAAEAIAAALKAGNDLCSDGAYKALPEALARGLVTEADLDRALRRLYALRFRLGQFDPAHSVSWSKLTLADNDTPAHDRLALEAARKSAVLLKNDGLLPWKAEGLRKVVVLGPTGDDQLALLGNYFGTPSNPRTIVKALRAKLQPRGVQVAYHPAVPLVAGFREAGQPLPEGVLFTDETRKVAGLKGELFAEASLAGQARATRVDNQVDLFWTPAQPQAGVPLVDAHLRWTGVLVPRVTGSHRFSLSFIGAARLFIDDTLVAGEASAPVKVHHLDDPRVRSAQLELVAGKSYRVRLEFNQRQGGAVGLVQLGWRPPGSLDEALTEAREADQIVLTLGLTPALEGEEMSVHAEGFAGGDRTSIQLPKVQQDLIAAVAALGKPFTVLLTGGGSISFDVSKPNAILEAWYYGQRGGDALAEMLLGEVSPSGRLPVTFYQADSDLPPFEDYSMANRTYRYFGGKPLYAFGHGLGYTRFRYDSLVLSQAQVAAGTTLQVRVRVSNTGSRAAEEVVQLYATSRCAPVSMPRIQLVGFARLPLQPGASGEVVLDLNPAQLRRWDEASKAYVVDAGEYDLAVGGSSDSLPLVQRLKVLR